MACLRLGIMDGVELDQVPSIAKRISENGDAAIFLVPRGFIKPDTIGDKPVKGRVEIVGLQE